MVDWSRNSYGQLPVWPLDNGFEANLVTENLVVIEPTLKVFERGGFENPKLDFISTGSVRDLQEARSETEGSRMGGFVDPLVGQIKFDQVFCAYFEAASFFHFAITLLRDDEEAGFISESK